MTRIIEAFTTFITATGVNGSTALALVLSGGLVYFIRELIFKQREDTKAQIEASIKTAEAMSELGRLLENIGTRQGNFASEITDIRKKQEVIHRDLTEVKVKVGS
tara:strand:- start:2546 stop:2860 length:315 start_codon:yes stop_codon:yes gene_type:complete